MSHLAHNLGIHTAKERCAASFKFGVLESALLDQAADVAKADRVKGLEYALVGDIEVVDDIGHVVPTDDRQVGRLFCRGRRGKVFAVAVERLVGIHDRSSLGERLNQKGIVDPPGPRHFFEPDSELIQEAPLIQGTPNRGVMLDQARVVDKGERLFFGGNPLEIGAVLNILLRRPRHADAPVGGLDHIGLAVLARQIDQRAVHTGLEVVIGLHDGDVGATRLRDTAVDRGTVALIGLVDNANAGVPGRMTPHDRERAVGRPVVEHDDLERGQPVRLDTAQALIEILLGVIAGNDDGHIDMLGQRRGARHKAPL